MQGHEDKDPDFPPRPLHLCGVPMSFCSRVFSPLYGSYKDLAFCRSGYFLAATRPKRVCQSPSMMVLRRLALPRLQWLLYCVLGALCTPVADGLRDAKIEAHDGKMDVGPEKLLGVLLVGSGTLTFWVSI